MFIRSFTNHVNFMVKLIVLLLKKGEVLIQNNMENLNIKFISINLYHTTNSILMFLFVRN